MTELDPTTAHKAQALQDLERRCFDAGLSVSELFDLAGITRGTLSRWRSRPAQIGAKRMALLRAKLAEVEA